MPDKRCDKGGYVTKNLRQDDRIRSEEKPFQPVNPVNHVILSKKVCVVLPHKQIQVERGIRDRLDLDMAIGHRGHPVLLDRVPDDQLRHERDSILTIDADAIIVLEFRGLEKLSRQCVELRLNSHQPLFRDPVLDAVIGNVLVGGLQVQDVTGLAADRFFSQQDSVIIVNIIGRSDVAVS